MKTRHDNSKPLVDQAPLWYFSTTGLVLHLTLALLVASVSRADHANGTVTTDDLAVSANLLN